MPIYSVSDEEWRTFVQLHSLQGLAVLLIGVVLSNGMRERGRGVVRDGLQCCLLCWIDKNEVCLGPGTAHQTRL